MCPCLPPSQQPRSGATAPRRGHSRKDRYLSPGNVAASGPDGRLRVGWVGWLAKQGGRISRGTGGAGWRKMPAKPKSPVKKRMLLAKGWAAQHSARKSTRPPWHSRRGQGEALASRPGSATHEALAKSPLSSVLHVPICERGLIPGPCLPPRLLEDWHQRTGCRGVASSPDPVIS